MTQPYSDFFTTFDLDEPTPQDKLSEWTLRGNFSAPLATGLDLGFHRSKLVFIKEKANDRHFNLYGDFKKGDKDPGDAFFPEGEIMDLDSTIGEAEYALNRLSLTLRLGFDKYIVLLNDILEEYDGIPSSGVKVFAFDSELELREFLQGILTMTAAFNVTPNEIIAVKPFKGKQDYDIQGIAPLPSIM